MMYHRPGRGGAAPGHPLRALGVELRMSFCAAQAVAGSPLLRGDVTHAE
jgi:hypothetical protein